MSREVKDGQPTCLVYFHKRSLSFWVI